MSRSTAVSTAPVEPDEEVTLTMPADETKRLVDAAFRKEPIEHPSTDDDITLDCPYPVLPPSSQPLPAPKMLTITPPPSSRPTPLPRVTPPPPSPLVRVEPGELTVRWRPHVTPALAQVARDLLMAENAQRRGGALKRNANVWLVAGIWAMALSLVVMLAFIVTSA